MQDDGTTQAGVSAELVALLRDDARFAKNYRFERILGRGGMAVVARCRQLSTRRDVAVKILEKSNSPDFAERFLREARTLAKVRHPNILQVFDLGYVGGLVYIVTELAPAGTLRDELIRDGALRLARVAAVLQPCARALAVCHRAGVVHRDLKPDNILFGEGGQPMLADFGLAMDQGGEQRLTAGGDVVGTLRYMAPELVSGGQASPASDVYALGVMLYEMLAGRWPHIAERQGELLTRIASGHITPLDSVCPDLPRDVMTLVERCLATRPEWRPKDPDELADALGAWSGAPPSVVPAVRSAPTEALPRPRSSGARTAVVTSPPGGRPRLPWTVIAAAAIGCAVGAAFTGSRTPAPPTPPTATAPASAPRDAPARDALRAALAIASEQMFREYREFNSIIYDEGTAADSTDTPRAMTKLNERAQRDQAALEVHLAPLRAARQREQPFDDEALACLTAGQAACTVRAWLAEGCQRIASRSDAAAMISFAAAKDSPVSLERQTKILVHVQEVLELAVESQQRLAARPDAVLLALVLEAVRSTGRVVAFVYWRDQLVPRVRTTAASFLRRIDAAAPAERAPIAAAMRGAWSWGTPAATKKEARTELAEGLAALRALAAAVPGRDLTALADRMQQELRIGAGPSPKPR